jgi:hypothetical protein
LTDRGNKNSLIRIESRREQLWTLVLRGFTARQILDGLRRQGLEVSRRTLYRDIQAIRADLLATKRASELYSLNMAFSELSDLWREAWGLYQRPPKEIQTDKGPVTLDDRGIKTLILRELRGNVHERAQMLGYFTPKVLERITFVETAAGRGARIERIPFDEQLARETEELRSNEGLRRSEGLIESTDN